MGEFEEQTVISTTREAVWEALADIGNIYRWNPGVTHSKQTTAGEVGVGAGRHCDLGGKNYLDEKVVEFERPHKLTIRITDTNLPFSTADIRFVLDARGDETLVRVSPKYRLKYGPLGKIIDSLMVRSQYRKGMRALLAGLKTHVEQGDGR